MEKKTLSITYDEYRAGEKLPEADKVLIDEAVKAREGAYAKYSNFKVGAAVRLEGGIIVRGANQENAAYPSGLCAERTAMFSASAQYPGKKFESIAVVCGFGDTLLPSPGSPCGACLQVMSQYERESGQPMRIILAGTETIKVFTGVESLLPFIFREL